MSLYLSQKKLLLLLLWALVLGFLFGLLYDCLRLFRRYRRPKGKVGRALALLWLSIEDFLFFVFGGVVASILFYVANSGKVRPSAFVASLLGFLLYRATLSRLFLALGERLIALIATLLSLLFRRVLFPPFRALGRLFSRLFGAWYLRKRKRAAARYLWKLTHLGQNGYFEGLRRL